VKNCVPFFFQQLIYSDLWQEIMRAGDPMRNVSACGEGYLQMCTRLIVNTALVTPCRHCCTSSHVSHFTAPHHTSLQTPPLLLFLTALTTSCACHSLHWHVARCLLLFRSPAQYTTPVSTHTHTGAPPPPCSGMQRCGTGPLALWRTLGMACLCQHTRRLTRACW
jgi:hypothetical protein